MHHRDASPPPLPHPPLEMIRKKRISLLFLESPDFYLWVSIFSFIRGWQVCKYINQVPLVGGLKAPGYVDATLREIVKVMHCVRLPSMAPPASEAPPPMLISVDEFNVIYIFWVQYIFFSGHWESGKTRERTHPPANECLYDLQQTSPSPCPSETPPPRQQNSEQDTWWMVV